jgi:hypothetical protein
VDSLDSDNTDCKGGGGGLMGIKGTSMNFIIHNF